MGDLDRISGLPDHTISHILSFIPTKAAVRTSVLSRSWRYRFASMSTFDFVKDCFETDNNFKMFVDRLLSFPNPSSLDCFKLHILSSYKDESRICRWISSVLSRGVKKLVLSTNVSPILSSHIFTSHSLVTLKVNSHGVIHIPTNISLPNLKILHLYQFTVLDDSLFKLISSCNVLEDLELTKSMEYGSNLSDIIIKNPSLKRLVLDLSGREFNHLVEINAPNLVYFSYDDDVAERYVLSDMKFLEIAFITIYGFERRDPPFLQAICNVQSLHIYAGLSKALSQTVLAFNNLVELELQTACGEWLVEFLHHTPSLKTLIILHVVGYVFKFIHERVPSCLSFHLKEIIFSIHNTNEHILQTISYFLNHALVLEKLRIRVLNLYSKEESGIMEKLMRLLGSRTIDVSVTDWCFRGND